MLGFRFCPRLRDFPNRRMAALGPPTSCPTIGSLLGKRVKTNTIREHWAEVLRLVASLQAGHVAPSAMLHKLAAYERQDQVDVTLQGNRQDRADFLHARLAGKSRSSLTLPAGPEQERTAPRSDAGDLHVSLRSDHRSDPRNAAISCLRAEHRYSCDRLLELHLYRRCRPAPPFDRPRIRSRAARSQLLGRLGAYCVLRRLHVGSRSRNRTPQVPQRRRRRLSPAKRSQMFCLAVV